MGTPTAPVAAQLSDWVLGLKLSDIPLEVRAVVSRHLADAVGNALGALRAGTAEPAVAVATGLGGPPEARLPGCVPRLGAVAAAFGTGALVHALDFDDTHAGGLVHVSAVVLPAALAVGQQVGASGEEMLLAAVAGFEVQCRLGAASPHGFHARGLHATSVCGPLAAAVVAASLLGLDAATTTQALGIAGSSSAGLLEFLETGSSTKQLHPGAAAAAGIVAARLAAEGATGPVSVLEGRSGVYAALSARPADTASITADLGERWEAARVTLKPYPACQLLHASLDAARELNPPLRDIDSVVAVVHPDAVDIVCEPRAGKVAPRSPYEAKFSLPWSVAAMLTDGAVGVDTYAGDPVTRPELAELAARVTVSLLPSPQLAAADAAGQITVRLRDGSTLVGQVSTSRGGVGNPLDHLAVAEKFTANAGPRVSPELLPRLLDLENETSLEPLLDLMCGASA